MEHDSPQQRDFERAIHLERALHERRNKQGPVEIPESHPEEKPGGPKRSYILQKKQLVGPEDPKPRKNRLTVQ